MENTELQTARTNLKMEAARASLLNCDEQDLVSLSLEIARPLAEDLNVTDNGFEGPEDLRERLLLMKLKMKNSGHKPYFQFLKVQAEAATKRRNLLEILRLITNTFSDRYMDGTSSFLTNALSGVLSQEKLLSKRNLLDELTDRMRVLQSKETLIVVAGETNSGKSTFLNVLLGQNILPTDVLHCTYVVCKIVYSHSYVIETLDYHERCKEYHCDDCEAAQAKLKELVTCDNSRRRQQSSCFKEITLKMPAEILKSGITLIDTPGIGENEAMDEVTINFVREAQASAFIYIIKSDGAGGVQEDRLLAFLRAVKENYKQDRLEGTFDPQAAMFVCHRWDAVNPSEAEKVRKNALIKLGMVWPGFHPSQTFLFSSKKAKLHLDVDPDYITHSFNNLLNGLKQLIDRATHNAIKYQYCWIKTFLQPACRHLRSMISNCTREKEDLDKRFRDIALKQECLMKTSNDQVPVIEEKITNQKAFLKMKVKEILSLNEVMFSDFDDYELLLSSCKEDKFLQSSENRKRMNHHIVACLIKYCDDYLLRQDILKPIEDGILQEIKEHLGLVGDQVKQIKIDIQGNDNKRRQSLTSLSGSVSRISYGSSNGSNFSLSSESEDAEAANVPDPEVLNREVADFLLRRKDRGKIKNILSDGTKLGRRIIRTLGPGGNSYADPKHYLDNQIKKLAAAICADEGMIDGFVSRYLRFAEHCLEHAIKCIPRFIAGNTELMNNVRENREVFLKNKQFMKDMMEKLEPFRAQLQGYGFLYMEDVHADQINYIIERIDPPFQLQEGLTVSNRPNDDSGFIGGGSTQTKSREKERHSLTYTMYGVLQKCFWIHLLNAKMKMDDSTMSVTIKTYSFVMEDSDQYSEIAALRCLEHENVASFFGMTRIDGKADESKPAPSMPAFIFKGQLWAANVYKKMTLVNSLEFVPVFLHQLWQGLDFIHMENLVHLELNLDTVMVDSQTGTVKLCQQCKPREAQLPMDLSCKTRAAVCLSPSVLQGNIYQISDDIYAYGLLMWELMYPTKLPYEEQRNWTLERFIEEVHPSKMLKDALESLNASHSVKTILDGCLICTKATIITMKDISSIRENMEPKVKTPMGRAMQAERRSNTSQTSESHDLISRSLDEQQLRNASRDITLRRKSEPQHIGSIPEENSSSADPPKRPPRSRRPNRHSVTVAPDPRLLDIPAHHADRRISLPNTPVMSNEKCEPVPPTSFAGDMQARVDYETEGPKRKPKEPKKQTSRNGKGASDELSVQRRRGAHMIPTVRVDPPDEQEANIGRSGYDRSSKKSSQKNPSVTFENDFTSLPQLEGEMFAEGQTATSISNKTYNPPMTLTSENICFPSGGSLCDSLVRQCKIDNTDGAIAHSENDFPIQSHSVPHINPVNTSAVHGFERQRPLKLKRGNVVRGPPPFQRQHKMSSERRKTEGDVKPLLEERIWHSRPVRSQTFTSGVDHDDNDIDLLLDERSAAEITDDSIQAFESRERKGFAGKLISKHSKSTSESALSPWSGDAGNVTQERGTSKASKALDNDSIPNQSANGTESLSSRETYNSAYQSNGASSFLTNSKEYEFSSNSSDDELSAPTCSTDLSLFTFAPVLNSPALPSVEQWSLDDDTNSSDIPSEKLPQLDMDDLSF